MTVWVSSNEWFRGLRDMKPVRRYKLEQLQQEERSSEPTASADAALPAAERHKFGA